jgi:hypothetical protein
MMMRPSKRHAAFLHNGICQRSCPLYLDYCRVTMSDRPAARRGAGYDDVARFQRNLPAYPFDDLGNAEKMIPLALECCMTLLLSRQMISKSSQ